MGTLYEEGISSGDIGGAIAEGILHDIRVNGLGLQGFPLIHVTRAEKGFFKVSLRFNDAERDFIITSAEAKRAVKLMKSRKGHSDEIFSRIQDAAAALEGENMNRFKTTLTEPK